MNASTKQVETKPYEYSFDITLEETLKALYKRRLEINRTLHFLEAEKREKVIAQAELE